MKGERINYKIADLIEKGIIIIGDGYRAKNEELGLSGLPFARGGNINGGFQFDGVDRFPVENLYRVGEKISRPGDVVFTSKGTVGRFSFVKEDTEKFVYSPQLCYWRVLDEDIIDPRFLFFWMFGREFFLQYNGVKSQTDMADYVSLADQRRMHITLPPLSEQRAIARILGSLDDKIELNRRTNATLEELARGLFRSWFVDFEPVRARAEGRTPAGMDAATAVLFPDGFETVDGREVPRGWSIAKIGDVCEFAYGKALKEETRSPGQIPVYGSNGQVGWHDTALVKGPGIIIGRKGNPGTVNLVTTDFFPIDTTFYAILKARIASWEYLRFALVEAKLQDLGSDSAVPGLNRNIAYMTDILVPSIEIIDVFENICSKISLSVAKNIEQSRTLAALRDALLPKLLSGELRVREAEGVGLEA